MHIYFCEWNETNPMHAHCILIIIHTLRVHYMLAAANLNSGYSKYAVVARTRIIFVQLHSKHLAQCWRERERRIGLIYASVGLIYLLNG